MKYLLILSGILILPASAALNITEQASMPTSPLVGNQENVSGTSALALGNAKGQTFSLSSGAELSGVVINLAAVTTVSDLTVSIYSTSGGLPTGAAHLVDSGTMPGSLVAGDFVQIDFASAVDLTAGSYAILLETTSSDVTIQLNNSNDYADGRVIRKSSATGGNWANGGNGDSDFVFALLGTVDSGGGESRPLAASGPNIIFILADDLGWTDHSVSSMAAGNHSDFYQTPNVARLASSGVSFTSAYAQPNCAPTRASLMTGQYSARSGNGVYNVDKLNRSGSGRTPYTTAASQGGDDYINGDESTVTIAESFYNSGYVTAHFGKYHVGSSSTSADTHPLNQGFDYNYGGNTNGNPGDYFASSGVFGSKVGPELDPFAANYTSSYISDNLTPYANGNDPTTLDGKSKHITDAMGDAFVSFMNDHRSGETAAYPVYAQVHFYAVHTPIQSRSDLKTKYSNLPNGTNHGNDAYAGLLENMDHTVGRILDYLEDPNGDGSDDDSIANNTLVIFTSDNGGHMDGGITSNVPLRGRKGMHYEGGIRVPLAIRMPGTIPNGKVSDTLTHCVDYYPTMLDFASGVFPDAVTHPLDGESLHAHLLDPDNVARDRSPVFYHFPGYMDSRAYACSVVIKEVDDKRYKYIYAYDPYYDPGNDSSTGNTTKGFDQYQLYNLTDDISESVNLLDYIDVENASDTNDPSASREYWDYLLHKDVANELADDLNSWLVGAPEDSTWNPVYSTYKSNFPDLDSALIGQPTGPAPAMIAKPATAMSETFRVTSSKLDESGDVTVTFPSEPGYTYQVQGSNTLKDDSWVDLGSTVTPTTGTSTEHTVNDPDVNTEIRRFYRIQLQL